MTVHTYQLQASKTARILFGAFNVRVRPLETIEIDFADTDQADAITAAGRVEGDFDAVDADPAPHHRPF